MNQGRIWTVVNPTIGLPLFLGAVALTSVGVHVAILTHTTWMSSYWQGGGKKTAMLENATPQVATLTPSAESPYTVTVTPSANGGASFVVTVEPKVAALTVAPADETPAKLALATPLPK
jgi:light-harvesting protein B-800-850 alpha chain